MFLMALFLSLILGFFLLTFLKKKSIFDSLREFIPYTDKKTTPTFGGFIFLLPLIFLLLFYPTQEHLFLVFGLCAFGALGFVDDYLKYKKNNKEGLSIQLRFILQWIIAFITSSSLYFSSITSKSFLGVYLGPLMIFLWAFMFVATSNAVNLTDGLDGLAMGLSLMIVFGFMFFIEELEHLTPFSIFLGSGLGFFYYNKYPARIFMGDTGSLPLGFFLAYCSILVQQEFLLIIFGSIFVFETLSVILQVLSFKYRKKRIFLMSPFHHHLQLKGWSEKKITYFFFVITFIIICSTLGVVYELQGL